MTTAKVGSSKLKFSLDLMTNLSLVIIQKQLQQQAWRGNLNCSGVRSECRTVSKAFKNFGCETEERTKNSSYGGMRSWHQKASQQLPTLQDSSNMLNLIPMFKKLTFQEGNQMAINQNTLKEICDYVIFCLCNICAINYTKCMLSVSSGRNVILFITVLENQTALREKMSIKYKSTCRRKGKLLHQLCRMRLTKCFNKSNKCIIHKATS